MLRRWLADAGISAPGSPVLSTTPIRGFYMPLSLWKRLRTEVQTLRDGNPGRRFQDYTDRRRERRGAGWSVSRIMTFVVGVILVLVGLAIGWLPGPGGFLSVIGLAVLAQEVPIVAKFLDWAEVTLRRLWEKIRYRVHPQHPWVGSQRLDIDHTEKAK